MHIHKTKMNINQGNSTNGHFRQHNGVLTNVGVGNSPVGTGRIANDASCPQNSNAVQGTKTTPTQYAPGFTPPPIRNHDKNVSESVDTVNTSHQSPKQARITRNSIPIETRTSVIRNESDLDHDLVRKRNKRLGAQLLIVSEKMLKFGYDFRKASASTRNFVWTNENWLKIRLPFIAKRIQFCTHPIDILSIQGIMVASPEVQMGVKTASFIHRLLHCNFCYNIEPMLDVDSMTFQIVFQECAEEDSVN